MRIYHREHRVDTEENQAVPLIMAFDASTIHGVPQSH